MQRLPRWVSASTQPPTVGLDATCRPRRAAAMVFVLILLLFISLLGATLARLAIVQHRQRLNDEIRSQTVRIAEAGWNRAAYQLATDPAFAGDVWQLDTQDLGAEHSAIVRSEILGVDGDPQAKRLRVTAEYPVDSPRVNRVTREGLLVLRE